MCGITGILSTDSKINIPENLVVRMNEAQFHRGPDEGAVYQDEFVALGHRRLSIIDVSSGQQPMNSQCDNYVLVFNGEIYNFQDVRKELEQLGHKFLTHSDTEVVLHAYIEWGSSSVQKLRGMFAFAVWDRAKETLFITRDRLGIKPIFYTQLNGCFYFASELKSIKLLPDFDNKIDIQALEQYFSFGYVAEPKTIYAKVAKLPPGHYLEAKVGSDKVNIQQYWDVTFSKQTDLSEEEYKQQLVKELDKSINSHMMSEVPLGSFLSGGVDSSAVVAMMAKQSDKKVKTFSIGFDVEDFNETDFARTVADKYATEHNERIVDSDDYELLWKLAELYDEPYADASAMPTYRVCQAAREQVTVCMSGDGADELLAGYRRYALHMNEEKLRSVLPEGIRKAVFKPLGKLYPKLDWAPQFLRAKTTFEALGMDTVEGYFHGVSLSNNKQRKSLFSDKVNDGLQGYSALEVFREHQENFDGNDPLSLLQYLDLKTYLVGDILTKVDRASMANSLEVRVPFLDHEFVEWALTVPPKYRIKNGIGKHILKRSMEEYLPHDVLYRKKMGFRVPLAKWFRGPLKSKLKETLLGTEMRDSGLFNMNTVEQWIDDHQSGRKEYSAQLWSLLMFAAFLKSS